ncbi:uncharacterized protein DNG_09740 [Cephalotrichum gorgonifer]|uniref:Heterokaryon incompatibility domain-containing protein n=1 Tax=Cephalotrichum gorgonifer TaxID=2041049 RepID=A0AAE8N691_9PEZI|nr:uncharacterized protein DNG_09740 [Cephalotrichum gorgonifer]
MSDTYEYEYLEPGSIRLLKITSLTPQIRLEFEVVTLDSPPVYNALSYRWVKSSALDVVLDGKSFQITSSLGSCIEHLAAHADTRIWIDAVCINQTDNAEKSHQVQAMSRIYRQAAKVLLWLGPSADDSDRAMEGIDSYGKAAFDSGMFDHGRQFFQKWPDVDGDDPAQLSTKAKLLDLLQAATGAEGDDSDGAAARRFPRLAFAKLTHRDYFSRVWVKQEVTLARETIMICGRRATTFDRFHAALMLYGMLVRWEIIEYRAGRLLRYPGPYTMEELMADGADPYEKLSALNTSGAPGPLCSGRKTFWGDGGGAGAALHSVLEQSYVRTGFEGIACEMPVDRIFGLLGIVSDAAELGIVADYSKTAAEVYEATARALVKQGHVDILKWCRSRAGKSPSWVPNWQARIESTWSEDSGMQIFKAARDTTQPPDDYGSGSVLRLRGAVIDKIAKAGSVWVADPALSFAQEACRTMFAEVAAFVEESRYAGPERESSKWRIPIGDKELPESSPYFARATERSKEQYEILAAGPLDSDGMEKTYSYQNVMGYTPGARPILSEGRYVGLGPSEAEPGDIIVLVWGGTTPYVLRPAPAADGQYLLIGEAFLQGIMDGEMMQQGLTETVFELL